ncbi:ribonuclease P protein subunit p14 [Clarias gariepinus]|uniref:ribonuclease P protein subunit p14 n=1 Tax=Clarias gariepinus TaxID=13013 RepID=UPI00234D1367|nr:ribonuclease P protein subunit p14 [Clarias gariepinus]
MKLVSAPLYAPKAECAHGVAHADKEKKHVQVWFSGGMEDKPASYERVVYKSISEFHYMKIYLVCENSNKTLSPEQFKHLIISGVKDLYGEVGAAFPFDLLTFDQSELSAILRVYNRGLVKLWSALTLIGSFENEPCAFRVAQVSPFLIALSGNSREMELY